jgi:hypothetical protein
MSVNHAKGKGRWGARPGAGRRKGVPNKLTRDIKALAAEHGEDSLAALVWLRDHAEAEHVRLGATTAILDRAYGRPRQEVDVRSDKPTVRWIVNRNLGCEPIAKVMNDRSAIEDHSRDDGTLGE